MSNVARSISLLLGLVGIAAVIFGVYLAGDDAREAELIGVLVILIGVTSLAAGLIGYGSPTRRGWALGLAVAALCLAMLTVWGVTSLNG